MTRTGAGEAGETVGQRLRRLRVSRGLSQRELAEPGVSYAYISRIESGSRQPSVKALRKLARRLGVSPEYLERGVDLAPREDLEIQIADAELALRLGEDTAEAERTLQALAAEAEASGDSVSVTRARFAIGLASLRRGALAEGIGELERVIDSGLFSPLLQPEVYGYLGRAYAASGRPERAVELFRGCLAELEGSPGHDASSVRFAVYLSYALADLGEIGEAREVLSEAIRSAEALSDPYMQARLYWSQARLASDEGKPRVALDHLRRAVAILETTEDRRQLGRAHLLWAEILTGGGEAGEAGGHLDVAGRLLDADADAEDRAWLLVERARHAAETGAAADAVEHARGALALLTGADVGEQGEAYWALAKGLSLLGKPDEANEAFRFAVERLEAQHDWRSASQASRDWADTLRQEGRSGPALEALERATELALRATQPSRKPEAAGELR